MINNEKTLYNLDRYFGDKKPVTADIFLTDFCNNKCPYCTYARYGERNGNYMSFKDFLIYSKILIENGVKGFILTGGGEPTINPDFDKITNWLETNNIEYGINTNFNVLKFIKPKYLKISLDAYDRPSYIERRGVDKYDTVMNNIKEYLKWKKENNVTTSIGVQIVVDTLDHAIKFYDEVKGLDVNYMNFRPIESTQGKYYKSEKEQFEKLKILYWLNTIKKTDPRVCINYKWEETETVFDKCYANFLQIALNERGQVMYCCHKPYEIIGHITDKDIWAKRLEATTNISMCDVPCRLTAPNSLIKKLEKGCTESNFI